MTHRATSILILVIVVATNSAHAQGKPAGDVLAAKLVSFPKGLTVAEALKTIADQTLIPVKDLRVAGKNDKLNCSVNGVTFWKALDTVAEEVGAALSLYHPAGFVALVDGKPPVVAPSHHGIFRSTVKRLGVARDLDAHTHQCQVRLEFAWEPWFKPFLMEIKSYHAIYAADAKGVEQTADGKVGWSTLADKDILRHAYEFDWRMPAPDRSSPAIKSLTGELFVIGPEKMLTVVFDDLKKAQAKSQQQMIDAIKVRLNKLVLKSKNYWEVEIDLDYPPGPSLDSFQSQSWLMHNQIWLKNRMDAKQTFPAQPYPVLVRFTANQATIRYYFKEETKKGSPGPKLGNPSDWQLIYVTPGRIVEARVPFAFKNVPLP
jgi:hypothetical protein